MSKPVGYSNQVPGNETTPIVEVMEYSEDQLAIQKNVRIFEEKIREGIKAQRDLKSLRSEVCKHEVFHDDDGFPYMQRFCNVCGSYMGSV